MRRPALAGHPAGVFFALAAMFAVILPWLWLLPLDDPRMAHLRLGIFGFGGAAVAGYVLTAQRAWTGRDAPLPAPLLGGLCLCTRLLALPAPDLVLALLPQGVVALAVLWPIIATRKWIRLPLAATPMVLVMAEGATVAGLLPVAPLPLAMAGLILIVGGRALPRFLVAEGERTGISIRAPLPLWTGAALATAGILLPGPAGAGLLVGTALWVGLRASGGLKAGRANQMLCLGYAGLVPALLGLVAMRSGLLPDLAATHLLTMGAMGPMILAFAARASMRRPARGLLLPQRRQWLALVLIAGSTLARVLAERAADPAPAMTWAGLGWSAAWMVFLSVHLAALRQPTPFPVLSASRADQAAS
jgi:uncharacterized protein involved in response to NO